MTKDRGQPRRRPPRSGDRQDSHNSDLVSPSKTRRKPKPIQKPVACLSMIVVSAVVVYLGLTYWEQRQLARVTTPLDVRRVVEKDLTGGADRYWGSYRPHAYFGLKTRAARSPLLGLMWFSQSVKQLQIRHWCDHNDRLKKFGWTKHDGVTFGRQEISDDTFTLTTEFVKRPGGDHGGDWTSRVKAKSLAGQESIISFLFYIALDGDGDVTAHLTNKKRLTRISGQSHATGNFEIDFPRPGKNLHKMDYLITHAESIDRLKETVEQHLTWGQWNRAGQVNYIALSGQNIPKDKQANFIVVQYTVTLPFEMEVVFQSGSFEQRTERLSGDVFQTELDSHVKAFDDKFEKIFQLEKHGYSKEEIHFAQGALSNMLGGIGYFHGESLVQSPNHREPVVYWQAPLYTAVPSRSFFPRGFLWDEGFHNLLISKWDKSISKDIIGHWLDLMNVDGWIPREQILGKEARAKVPKEFIVQKSSNANPPTLFLPLQDLVQSMVQSSDPRDKEYLERIYPRLKTWYDWYNTTQFGEVASSYRWRGRDAKSKQELNPKTLTSGLDDYPRASHPTDQERHLDLRCWMALASGIMSKIAQSLGQPYQDYQQTHEILTDEFRLNELHWSQKAKRYGDYGLHTDQCKLEWPQQLNRRPGEPPLQLPMERVCNRDQPKMQFVESYGYVSLFPFLLKILEPKSPKLGSILRDLSDPNLLWTEFGLRSLAKNAPLYKKYNTEHDPPYWRGAIWINMNFLAIRALHFYSHQEGPYKNEARELYVRLRSNVIGNVYRIYKSSGYIWEQYSDDTGIGKGTHPFTGWSALVVIMMSEEF